MSNFYTSVERQGNNILWRGYNNGERFSHKVPFKPTLFMGSKNATGKYTALNGGTAVEPKKFANMREAKDFADQYKDMPNFNLCGNTNFIQQFIHERYPDNIEFNVHDINIASFDIEVDISKSYPDVNTADKAITSIAYKSSRSEKYFLLGQKDYDKHKTLLNIPHEDIVFVKFDNEATLLTRFVDLWKSDYPDVVTGWNVEYFDIMYIVTRIMRVLGESKAKQLSPWGNIRLNTREVFNKPQSTYSISGLSIIDYMDAFKKFGYKYGPQENYKLDTIAYTILGEAKLDYSEYGNLTTLYEQNPQLYLDYNLKDTWLIHRFEEESGLLALVMTVAYDGGVNYGDAFGTVGIWESTLYRRLMRDNVIPPLKRGPGHSIGDLVGGYVKMPKVGMHKWCVSFDLNSLYPMLMMQYNMSPETFVKGMHEYLTPEQVLSGEYQNENKSMSVAVNGACFDNTKIGLIPSIIDEYYARRRLIKDKMLDTESDVERIKEEIARRGLVI